MIYIAGKIDGLPYEVAETKFKITETELHSIGVKTINPMEQGFKHMKYEDQMEQCLNLIRVHATAIFLHRDWKESDGTRREFLEVAQINRRQNNRINIYYEEMGGYNDIRRDVKDKVLTCTYDNFFIS